MATIYGRARNPLATRPSPVTGTMAQWKTWADGLTRSERDQLYPGMHIDLIPAYEVINQKAALPDPASGFGTPAATDPASLPPGKPVSPFGPSNPQALPFGSVPLQTPNRYGSALASTDPRQLGAGALTGFGLTQGVSRPDVPFGNTAPGNNGLDINAFASSLASSVQPGNTAGTAIKRGLLDLSYAEGSDDRSQREKKRGFWGWLDDAIDEVGEGLEEVWDGAVAAWNYADEFVDLFLDASDADQMQFLRDVAMAIAELNPAIGVLSDIRRLIDDPSRRTPGNIALMVASIVPIFRSGRIGIKIRRIVENTMRKLKSKGKQSHVIGKRGNRTASSGKGDRNVVEETEDYDGIFRRTPEVPDVLKGAIEAIATEAFDIFWESLGAAIGPSPEKPLASTTNVKRLATAGTSGGLAGLSAGFQSDDQAEFAVQLIIDSFTTAFHVWSMQSIKGNSEIAGLQAAGTMTVTALAGTVKILAHGAFVKLMSKRWRNWPPAARRRFSRWSKIAINKIADKIAKNIISTI